MLLLYDPQSEGGHREYDDDYNGIGGDNDNDDDDDVVVVIILLSQVFENVGTTNSTFTAQQTRTLIDIYAQ